MRTSDFKPERADLYPVLNLGSANGLSRRLRMILTRRGWGVHSLMRRSLLFVLIDCLRAGHCYWDRGLAKTPVFNRLRQQGT